MVSQRFETAATSSPPRSITYSWSSRSPFISRSSGPGTSMVNLSRNGVNSFLRTSAAFSPPLRLPAAGGGDVDGDLVAERGDRLLAAPRALLPADADLVRRAERDQVAVHGRDPHRR